MYEEFQRSGPDLTFRGDVAGQLYTVELDSNGYSIYEGPATADELYSAGHNSFTRIIRKLIEQSIAERPADEIRLAGDADDTLRSKFDWLQSNVTDRFPRRLGPELYRDVFDREPGESTTVSNFGLDVLGERFEVEMGYFYHELSYLTITDPNGNRPTVKTNFGNNAMDTRYAIATLLSNFVTNTALNTEEGFTFLQ